MDKIAEVELRKPDRPQQFRCPGDIDIKAGDICIVETAQGTVDYGKVCGITEAKSILKTLSGKLVRRANETDLVTIQENCRTKPENLKTGREKINEYNLDMKLIDAEYSFDRTRITFYYWADGRIDFRALVKDLAKIFNCRIEMRQIGLRDEAKIKGGFGICGCPLCCAQFLKKLDSVTMRMVKNQKLPLDINKITGQCGRLLCCLCYEEDFYKKDKARKK